MGLSIFIYIREYNFEDSVLGTRMVTRTCVMLSVSWIVGLVILWGGCFGGVNASADETLTRADKERLFYLSTIFEKYSNNNEILLQNVEKLLVNLGIPQSKDVLTLTHEVDNAENDTHCHDTMAGCPLSDPSLGPTGQKPTKRSVSRTDVHKGHNKCLNIMELLSVYHFKSKSSIGKDDFMNLCPSLIVHLDKEECRGSQPAGPSHDGEAEPQPRSLGSIPLSVWGYSSLAILIISLVGLLGVAVIPIMQRVFYNHLLQFLVALAVGALSGDAMLHLIPHALAGGHEEGHAHEEPAPGKGLTDEQVNVFKGLTALIGIFIFFFIERIMTIVTDLKRKRREEEHYQHQLELAAKLGEEEIEQIKKAHELAHVYNHEHDCESLNWGIHPGNRALEHFAQEATKELHEDEVLMKKIEEKGSMERKESKSKRKMSRSHSHSHSHGEGIPKDVAAVAWMVILGDGIHNFCDGLAIGSAFAASVTGGISTTIAVFCHELPHEIGDFAVLLKAGMKPKQALVYNVVSSVLAFGGMLIGVMLGNIESASLWIFTVVGGMFLYIALVDMLPEMMSVDTRSGENPFFHLVFQACGMFLGIGIMFVIAMYEDNMKSMMEP
uniref:Zinc transporter ZIP10-like isoform X2 n=1 Tax=Crassostrea virginica TaxID=6565 RepID=A0A8B8ALW6_CRAVI|nr:zinc transporter ZIP10-like isoform X2 [Crassostrea virginica]